MGKKTILRVEDGVNLSETQLNNLKEITGGDFDIQQASLTADLQRSYQLRADSFKDAFSLIVKSVSRQSKASFNSDSYLDWAKNEFVFAQGLSRDQYEEILTKYTRKLLEALVTHWLSHVKLEHRWGEAIELLNKAEQYHLMMTGRPDLATLTPITIRGEAHFILQKDTQLPPLTDETRDELEKIKASVLSTTPDWFRALPVHQQVYLHGLQPTPTKLGMLKSSVNDFMLHWNELKKDKNLENELLKIKSQSDVVPSWFSSLTSARREFLLAVLRSSSNPLVDVSQALDGLNQLVDEMQTGKHVNPHHLAELAELPFWYVCLPDYEQQLLKHVLKSNKNINEVTSFLPSRLRTLPGVPNFCEHQFMILNNQAQVLEAYEGRYRSSHAGSREVKDYPEQVSRLHTQRNGARIREATLGKGGRKKMLLQTLISPVPFSEGFIPDRYLEAQRQKVVGTLRQESKGKNIDIFTSNHPFNVARYVLWTSSKDTECLALLDSARELLTSSRLEKRIDELNLQDKEKQALTSLLKQNVAFIESNKNPKDYSTLSNLATRLDLSQVNLSVLEWQDLVKQAVEEIKTLKQAPSFVQGPLTQPAQVRQALINLLYSAKDNLTWSDWQPLFAQQLHWHSLANKPRAASTLITDVSDLALLANEYEATLKSGWGTATFFDYNGRELFLSSLENLLMLKMQGVSYGSCVSGKDRKAIEAIHTDAMLLYRYIYGYWPSYNDTGLERSQFVNLFAKIYLSRHQHMHAGQNAPGSEGLKTPDVYLPADIAQAIRDLSGQPDILTRDDCLASNNEVKRVVIGSKQHSDKVAIDIEAAKKLSESHRVALLNKLKALMGQKKYWHSKTTGLGWGWNAPAGISKIKCILDRFDSTQHISSSETILAEIYAVVRERPMTNSKRDEATQKLYALIRELCVSKYPQSIIDVALSRLDSIKEESFSMSNDTTTGVKL
ncbi:hypothetical protein GH742_00835 [Legionella sp. MW5194]|uniref:Dot/Icm T4SS effector PI-3-phosphatase SidP n=1 Tax=Legionella sp. MW5194 TaxID=2662448 RepID=UPI00193E821E|nr:Dot/Icm T4SS effector PI-3-phosphatase SidP [Legionella sp. MW5194]QRN02536.1 hypothetical protein GH742_00835 [Legionella sp. MW5194]